LLWPKSHIIIVKEKQDEIIINILKEENNKLQSENHNLKEENKKISDIKMAEISILLEKAKQAEQEKQREI